MAEPFSQAEVVLDIFPNCCSSSRLLLEFKYVYLNFSICHLKGRMFTHICEWDLLLRTWFISEAWNFPRLPFVCQNSVTDYWVAHLEYFCVVACFLSCFREGPGSWRNNIPTNSVRLSWRLDVEFLNFYWFFFFERERHLPFTDALPRYLQ